MVTMSQKEFQRVKVIENAAGGRLSVREASRLLQLSQRQCSAFKRRYRPDSLDWVQHGNRGRCMPWAVSIPQKQLILSLARGKYQGFNDSHWRKNFAAKRTSRSAARPCAASCVPPNWRRRRSAGRASIALAGHPATLRHDGAHRCQPSRLARRPRPPAHSHRLFRMTPPARSWPLTSNSKPKTRSAIFRAFRSMIATHGIPLSLYRDRHSIFQRNDAHWTLAEQLAGKQTPTQLGRRPGRARHPTNPRLFAPGQGPHRTRLAHWPGPSGQRTSPGPGRHCAASQWGARPLLRRSQAALRPPCHRRRLRLSPLPRHFDLARCLSLRYQRVVAADHTVTLGAHSIALPPYPAIAATPEKPSNSRISSMARYASIAATFCCSPCPAAGRIFRPPPCAIPPRRNEKPDCLASTTSPAAPL